jgi:hypothetical protein
VAAACRWVSTSWFLCVVHSVSSRKLAGRKRTQEEGHLIDSHTLRHGPNIRRSMSVLTKHPSDRCPGSIAVPVTAGRDILRGAKERSPSKEGV